MPYLDDHNKIRNQAKEYKVSAPEGSWERIESKLKANDSAKAQKKIKLIRTFLSIAASVIVLVGFFSIVYLESSQPQLVQKGQIEDWKELSSQTDYFYSVQNARRTNLIFDNLFPDSNLSLPEGASGLPVIFGHDPI